MNSPALRGFMRKVRWNDGLDMMDQCGERIRVVHPLFQVEGGGSIPTSPLQLTIGRIDKKLFKALNSCWHSRLPECGNVFGGMAFGAEYDGLLYAVAYWSNPVSYHVDDGKTLELRRMAVADDAPKNTPSRFLRVMVLMIQRERPDIQKLVSYQDPTYHAGTIYKAAGWINEGARKNNGFDKSKRPWRQRKADVIPGDKVRWAKIMSNA